MKQKENLSLAPYLNVAGMLLFIAALQWFVVEMAAETLLQRECGGSRILRPLQAVR